MSDVKFRNSDPSPTPKGSFRLDKRDGKIGGVAAGLSRHFGFDVTLIRIAFVLGALLGLGGLLIYLAIWLIAD